MGHWYTTEGKPMYTMPKADGSGDRDTTLRDARKLGLLPSVTTITKMLAAPALEAWKMRQALEQAYNSPPIHPETLEDCQKFWMSKAEESGIARMEFGTKVHDTIELALSGKEWFNERVETPAGEIHDLAKFVNPATELFTDNAWKIVGLESVLVGQGYAGKTDAIYIGQDEYGIIDFKTTKDATKPFIPASYKMQIAMYHVAEHGSIDDKAAGYNIFISTEKNIGAVKAVRYDAEELRKAWKAAQGLISAWQYENNYYPEQ